MTAKRFLVISLIAINCYSNCGAALRRTPKVYNALITTDENLATSRAYPVIQPTIHETGLAHYPFGSFNPYSVYNPFLRFGQAIAPGLHPRPQLPYALPQTRFPPKFEDSPPPNEEPQLQDPPQQSAPVTPTNPMEYIAPESTAIATTTPEPTELPPSTTTPPEIALNENLSIPLNEYGLPPALIPLPQYPSQAINSVNLPAYRYKQYPLIYDDPLVGNSEQYLPPYQYYPGLGFSGNGAPQPSRVEATDATNPVVSLEASFQTTNDGLQSFDSRISGVPPARIPSGAKSKEA